MATPVKRVPRGKEAITDAVLDAAERLFAAGGPGAVSLREIADEAGITYSLINRHFGTKEALFVALLDRYALRWAPRLGDEAPLRDRLEQLLGPGPEQGAYLRLLAWSLLQGDVSEHAHRSVLDQLVGEPDDEAARADVAVMLSLLFGWRFFRPFVTAALHIDDPGEAQRVHEHVREALRSLSSPERRPPVSQDSAPRG